MTLRNTNFIFLSLLFLSQCEASPAPKDVVRIMSYNVLKYGDGCQGPINRLHANLRTIINYTDPDILGLIKVAAIKSGPDARGKAPTGFADSILANALNAAHPGRYAYCPFTNTAKSNAQNLLFYNKNKFGFSSFVTLVSDITDIDLYKLFYLEPNLPKTHDTAFIYIVLVHTESGDKPDERDTQMNELMTTLRKLFPALPNIIIMGDFNCRKTNEPGYQVLTNNSEQRFRLLDPPFVIDKQVSYPANWDKHPESFSGFLTTSTRKSDRKPNDCGTGGGAKGWYDHIFLSPSLANGSKFYNYIRRSYHTIGNDGRRINLSVNDQPNMSAPAEVLDALYQMSNKYPVILELGINPK